MERTSNASFSQTPPRFPPCREILWNAEVPDSVRLHVLPSGTDRTPTASLLGQGTVAKVDERMARAFEATSAYLEGTTR